jgi:HSP20 family protein
MAFEKFREAEVGVQFDDYRSLFHWHDSPRSKLRAQAAWTPAVSIHEEDTAILLSFDVPGMSADDIGVHLENNVLTVRGERQLDYGTEAYSRVERPHGAFSRSFMVPEQVEASAVTARLVNGVLSIRLPKRTVSVEFPAEENMESLREVKSDANYEAYLRDAGELSQKFPGQIVAYADGKRIAEGKDARDLADRVPAAYRKRELFITDVSPEPLKFRRPFRILEK